MSEKAETVKKVKKPSDVGHAIKKREKPSDVFITPVELAKKHIGMIETKKSDVWFDPFKNTGNYYNNFPTKKRKWTEILKKKDFFEFDGKVDIICSNPPFSCINKVLKKCVSLEPRVISLVLGSLNISPARLEYMEKKGYKLINMHMTKVYDWFSFTYLLVWEKDSKKDFKYSYDRIIWKN